jgi:hypothetical protein
MSSRLGSNVMLLPGKTEYFRTTSESASLQALLMSRLKAGVREVDGVAERAHLMKANQGCGEDRYWTARHSLE